MRELLYTILELEEWNKKTCDFCSGSFGNNNKAVCQIRTRSKLTDKIVENDVACEKCKEKFENDEITKCERCGKLQTKLERNIYGNGYTCNCSEDNQEKELPALPCERRPHAFYERQINGLREEKTHLEEEIDIHLEALEISKDWHKRKKRELLDEIDRLKKENIVKEERIRQLEEQLSQLNSQSISQIEVKEVKKWPWKLRK